MKALYLLPALLLILIFANALPAQAQPQEETIAWVQEKFKKHSFSFPNELDKKVISIMVEPCRIIYTVQYFDTNYSLAVHHEPDLPVLPTMVVEPSTDGEVIYIYPDKDAELVHIVLKEKETESVMSDFNTGAVLLVNQEPNFAERMQKNLRHLATFCEAKNEAL